MDLNKSDEWLFNQENLEEVYDDIRWRIIINKYAQVEGDELLKLNKEIKKDPHYQISETTNKKIFNLLNKYFRGKNLHTFVKKSQKIFTKIAVVFFVFSAILAVTFTTVEAFRVQVLNFFLTFEPEYTSLKFEKGKTDGNMTAGFNNIYAPSYIPEGYQIDNLMIINNFKEIKYVNEEGIFISFFESSHSSVTNIDTENADILKSIAINGAEGLFVLKNELVTVSWAHDNRIFVITAQISEEEMVKIAESVIFIK